MEIYKMDFYFGADKGRLDRLLAKNHENILYSTAFSYNLKYHKFWVPKNLHGANSIFIDSGGYSFMKKQDEYPFELDEYIDWIENFLAEYQHKVTAVATPDYPIRKNDDPTTVKTKIDKTFENGFKIINELNHLGMDTTWYIPIHGKTLEDYIYAAQKYFEYRIPKNLYANSDDELFDSELEWMAFEREEFDIVGSIYSPAIGSLKNFNKKQIEQICKTVRSIIPSQFEIHAFGLPYSIMKNPTIYNNINSTDSGAWRGQIPTNYNKKVKNYWNYRKKLNSL